MNKVGLLGGTFDPVHNGHLQLGKIVLDSIGLDRVLFIPAAHPPHKNEVNVSNSLHRLEMLRIALTDRDRMELSDIEMVRYGMSYTIDTLEELKRYGETRADFHFIIGSDAIADIETWYRWQELLVSVNFIVAVRPGFSVKEIETIIGRNGFVLENEKHDRWIHQRQGNEIMFLADKTIDISSTDIRDRISSGRNWRHMVPDQVGAYICAHHLYGALNS